MSAAAVRSGVHRRSPYSPIVTFRVEHRGGGRSDFGTWGSDVRDMGPVAPKPTETLKCYLATVQPYRFNYNHTDIR